MAKSNPKTINTYCIICGEDYEIISTNNDDATDYICKDCMNTIFGFSILKGNNYNGKE